MLKRKDGFSGERALVLPAAVIREMESEPALSMLHITDIGYYPKAWNHFRERQEPISQYVLIYCTEGKGWFRAGGEKYVVEKDQYFVLPAHRPHSYGADEQDPWTIYWVHFKGKLAGEYAGLCLKPTAIRPNTYSRIGERLSLFEEIYHTLEMGYGRENLMYACSVFYYFLGSLHYVQQYRGAVKQENDEGDLVAAAIHYMKENVEKKLTLKQIAGHIGYSSSHFSALFHARTGYSPLNYFNQLKIQQACRLLDFSNMKINQICYKTGIDDCYYFSRLFTKIMGMSPREYKKQKKG